MINTHVPGSARELWIDCLSRKEDRDEQLKEIGQMLLDAMDLLEQEPEERPVIAAYEAFERARLKLKDEMKPVNPDLHEWKPVMGPGTTPGSDAPDQICLWGFPLWECSKCNVYATGALHGLLVRKRTQRYPRVTFERDANPRDFYRFVDQIMSPSPSEEEKRNDPLVPCPETCKETAEVLKE